MICPKCGHRNDGASWYCGSCGIALSDLNVADSVRGRRGGGQRWMLLGALGLIAATGLGLLIARWLDGRAPRVAERPSVVGEVPAGEDEPAPAGGERGASGELPPATGLPPASAAEQAAAERATAMAAAPGGGESGEDPAPSGAEAAAWPTAPPAPTATPTLSARVRPQNPVWIASRLAEAPEIDGGFNDWSAPLLAFDAVVFGEEEDFEGTSDISARTWAGWDPEALYLGVRVYDNVFSQPDGASSRKMYLGDSLELQLDTNLEADWDSDVYSGDDWQIGLSPGNFRGREPEAWTWRPTDRNAAGTRIASLLLDDGYAIEASLPWTLLEVDPTRTEAIGWALNVSDNDLPVPVQQTMISTSPARSWTDPRSFGTLVLGQ